MSDLAKEIKIDGNVYNGTKKIVAENKIFINRDLLWECLKIKNSEGFDRIPQ